MEDTTVAAAASSVTIDTTAKGLAVLKVKVVDGVTEEEMERLKNLAIRTYEVATRELGQRAEFQ